MKKLLILNIPHLVLGLLFTKLPEAWRYANGADLGQKILNLGEGLSRAFAVPFPSFYPADLFIGLAIGALLRLIIYVRSKNAKSTVRVWSMALPGGATQRILSHM